MEEESGNTLTKYFATDFAIIKIRQEDTVYNKKADSD